MSRTLLLFLCLALLAGCPPTLVDDDDATADDDDATMDDDDGTDPEPTFCSAGIPESQILAAVYGGPKVPAGYWSDPATSAQWWAPCSDTLATTQANAASRYPLGTPTGNGATTTWFHEVEMSLSGGSTVLYRNTRCDWFDGTTLAGGPFAGWAELQELVGYLWWTENHNLGGAHIVGGVGNVGGATNFFSLCHVSTVFGDFGIQDEITVWETGYGILQQDGTVNPSPPQQQGVVLGAQN